MTWTVVEPEPSPSWIASSARWEREGDALLRRSHDPADEAFLSPLPAILAAVTAAGTAGIAPAVVSSDSSGFTTALIPGSRPAKLDDLADEGLLRAALALRTRFRALDVALPERCLFEDVARLREAHRAAGVPVPAEADELARMLELFAARRERFALPPRPCHGSGAVSNLLLCPDGPKLTGWSLVALRDPLEEAGSVVGELSPWLATGWAVLEALDLPDESEMVAWAWAVADSLLWGLIASWRMATAQGEDVDYIKYGLWRLTQARAAANRFSDVADWLGNPR